ncbi:hypothetical protein [Neptunicella sp. SCSIO 80796]|uniref:hypothetical protein n=1 Tax=Neptunicella plasticusilytica TaxID=3117012 RepID=UPI003A4DDB5B
MTPKKALLVANVSMLLTLVAFCGCVLVAYGLDDYFPLMVIVLMHVAQIVLAGLFKFSYVLRLVAQKQLGQTLR